MSIIVIVGPTGVGKTKLSIELAKKYDGEVINADSTQVYKCLDIATAKVTEEEKDGIIHHLLDIKDIKDDYTVYDYQIDCRNKINDILSRGKTAIIVGGTGLYIKAALYDYQFEEKNMVFDYSSFSNQELYDRLLTIEPNTKIHINNRRRVERALSYYESTGMIMGDKEKTDNLLYDAIIIGLTTSRDVLYDRINRRVDLMLENGLLEEAKKLYDSGMRSKAVMTPIGYKELFMYFDGLVSFEESVDLIKQRSRRYAKRQYTWFNHQMNVNWFDVDFDCFSNTCVEIESFIGSLKD